VLISSPRIRELQVYGYQIIPDKVDLSVTFRQPW